MKPLDYGRSFLLGRSSKNEVRFWVESRTRIVDTHDGSTEDYLQAGACKSERTFAPDNLFVAENYDFLPVFGPRWGVIFRRRATACEGYRSCLPVREMWDGPVHHLVRHAGAELLTTNTEVREATYAFAPIVAQTEIHCETTGLQAIIEYPVKTLNTHRADDVYQVDSGPVVLPDLTVRRERHVDGMRLAFVAFNAPHFADFIIEARTPVGSVPGAAEIYHYSEHLSLPAENRLYSLRD